MSGRHSETTFEDSHAMERDPVLDELIVLDGDILRHCTSRQKSQGARKLDGQKVRHDTLAMTQSSLLPLN